MENTEKANFSSVESIKETLDLELELKDINEKMEELRDARRKTEKKLLEKEKTKLYLDYRERSYSRCRKMVMKTWMDARVMLKDAVLLFKNHHILGDRSVFNGVHEYVWGEEFTGLIELLDQIPKGDTMSILDRIFKFRDGYASRYKSSVESFKSDDLKFNSENLAGYLKVLEMKINMVFFEEIERFFTTFEDDTYALFEDHYKKLIKDDGRLKRLSPDGSLQVWISEGKKRGRWVNYHALKDVAS